MEDVPAPIRTPVNEPYWSGLDEGELRFQRCSRCGGTWLPAREDCPHCLHPETRWEKASGKAQLISWVIYRQAYHPYFADRLPYNVAIVELSEGPRLISNIVGDAQLRIDMPLVLVIQREGGLRLPRFEAV